MTRAMALLFDLLWLTLVVTSRLIRSAVAKACLSVPVPPPNWNNTAFCRVWNGSMVPYYARSFQFALPSETKCTCQQRRRSAGWIRRSRDIQSWLVDPEEHFNLQRFSEKEVPMMSMGSVEVIMLEDVPAMIEIPRNVPKSDSAPAPDISDDGDTTLCSVDSRMLDFSIYADASLSSWNKAVLVSPTMRPTRDVNFTALTAASERVSEILRENRRRLDAGEDSNIARREARRKRAQELSAVRNYKSRSSIF